MAVTLPVLVVLSRLVVVALALEVGTLLVVALLRIVGIAVTAPEARSIARTTASVGVVTDLLTVIGVVARFRRTAMIAMTCAKV